MWRLLTNDFVRQSRRKISQKSIVGQIPLAPGWFYFSVLSLHMKIEKYKNKKMTREFRMERKKKMMNFF